MPKNFTYCPLNILVIYFILLGAPFVVGVAHLVVGGGALLVVVFLGSLIQGSNSKYIEGGVGGRGPFALCFNIPLP